VPPARRDREIDVDEPVGEELLGGVPRWAGVAVGDEIG
jgi:hypothetical protein